MRKAPTKVRVTKMYLLPALCLFSSCLPCAPINSFLCADRTALFRRNSGIQMLPSDRDVFGGCVYEDVESFLIPPEETSRYRIRCAPTMRGDVIFRRKLSSVFQVLRSCQGGRSRREINFPWIYPYLSFLPSIPHQRRPISIRNQNRVRHSPLPPP